MTIEQAVDLKAVRRKRYQRQFARNKPAPKSNRYPAMLGRIPPRWTGIPEYLQQVVRMTYGAKGTWGHGKYQNGTKSGPGRRPLGWTGIMHPAGSKLARKIIRTSGRESTFWRKRYTALTGKVYGE